METMTTTSKPSKPARKVVPMNGVDTPTLFATLDAVKGTARAREVPVPRDEPLAAGHPQPHAHRVLQRRGGRARSRARDDPRRGSPAGARRTRPGPDAGRVPAPRARRLHHRRDRQHRRRARRDPLRGRVHGRGRHRPARHLRPLDGGPERLRAAPNPLPDQGRRSGGDAPADRRAVAGPLRGLRRAHARRARRISVNAA